MKKTTVFVSFLLVFTLFLPVLTSAADLAGTEKKAHYKGVVSPMADEPKTVSFTKGENVVTDSNYRLSLDGAWELTDKGAKESLIKGKGWDNAISAPVPGSIHTALTEAGVIEDPYASDNMKTANKYGQQEWYYKKTFNYEGSGKNVYLNFDGVCNVSDFYLNGEKIGSHEGMFGGPYIDVTNVIKKGENTLVVHLSRAKDYTQTVVFNCSYGWHYAKLYPLGIWQSVEVEDRSDTTLDSPFVTTTDYKNGTLDFAIALNSNINSIKGELTVSVIPKNFKGDASYFTEKVSYDKSNVNLRYRADLPDAKLWWPNGYGEQNLYTLKVTFKSDGGMSCTESEFGVRQLEFEPFPSGEHSNAYNRQFVVNGVKVYMKGAGWCTIDAMMRFSRDDYDKILSRAHDAGINFLRAWGGGLVETDEFYDLCDEYGICVYQEWPCCWDSSKTQPADVLYETVELNTKRMRNRPSLFVYGGGNEGNASYSDKVLTNMGKLTYSNDGTRDFWRQDGGAGAANIRHDHIWWSGYTPEYYIKTYTSVQELNMHEYGLGSMMNRSSIEKYASKEELNTWPIKNDNSISYHTATFNGFYNWQPTPHGYDIDTHTYYASTFTDVNGLDDLIIGSQLAQAQADYPLAINSRIKAPYNSSNVIYKLNDNYPGASWSIVDWYGAPKLSYYLMQDAYRSVMAACMADCYNTYNGAGEFTALTVPVYVLDDTAELAGKKAQVKVTAYGSELQIIKTETFECKTGGTVNYANDFTLTAEQTANTPMILTYDLIVDGGFYNRTYMYYNYEIDPGCLFYLPRTTLEYTVSGNTVTIKNTGDKLAVGVELSSDEEDTFICSDNMFLLDPGESQTVTVNDAKKLKDVTCFNIIKSSDKTAPSAPANVTVSDVTQNSAKLSWSTPDDDTGIYKYEVTLNTGKSEQKYSVRGTKTDLTVNGLDETSEYTVTVSATDNGGNTSSSSAAVKFVTEQDKEAPVVLDAYSENGKITLKFSKEMNKKTAEDVSRFLLDQGASVTAAELSEDKVTVTLTVEGMKENTDHILGIINLTDTKHAENGTGYVEIKVERDLYMAVDFETKDDGVSYSSGKYSAPLEAVLGEPEYTKSTQSGKALSKNGAQIKGVSYTFGKGKTITMWIKGKATDGYNVLLAKGPKESGHFEFYTNNAQLYMYAPDCGDFKLDYDLNKNTGWRQLAFVVDGNKLSVYENGTLVSSKNVSVRIAESVNSISFGMLNDGSLPFAGYIDTVRFYDRALSAEELADKLSPEKTDDEKLDFENHVIELNPGDTADLGLISGDIKYELSLSGDAATVKDGKIHAEKEGTAVISVMSDDKMKMSGAVVTVKEKVPETEYVTETDTEAQSETESETQQTDDAKPGGNVIIIVIVASVTVAAAAVIAVIVIKNKKK